MMEKIKLITESYLFNGQNAVFRAIPFYELSNTEWVIYEDGEAKYYVDANRRNDPIVKMLMSRINYEGGSIEQFFKEIGERINHSWTTHSGLEKEIENSWQEEQVELYVLTDLKEVSYK